MKRTAPALLTLLLAIILLNVSCKKENTEIDYNPLVNSSKGHVFMEDVFVEIFNLFYKATNTDSVLNGFYAFIDDCDIQYNSSQNRITFSYGAVSRYCYDNKFRRNSYQASFNGPPDETGTVATITFDSLYVEDNLVGGTVEIIRMAPGQNDDGQWSVRLQNCTIERYIRENGNAMIDTLNMVLNTNYVFALSEGSATTENFSDDVLLITGTSNGISYNADAYSTEITEALEDRLDCFWIVKGMHQLSVQGSNAEPGDVDYITDDGCNYRVDFHFGDNLFYEHLTF